MTLFSSLIGSMLSLLLTTGACAQALFVQQMEPRANAVAAPRNGPLQLTLSHPISAQAATPEAVRIISQWRGRVPGTYSGAGTPTLTFVPTQPLLAGEPVQVTVTSRATSQTGTAPASAAAYQFTTATAASAGRFLDEEVTVGFSPQYLATGDLNGDGHLDFVASNTPSSRVYVRLGDGQGGFMAPPAPIPEYASTASTTTHNVALADVNEDGRLDLIALNVTSVGGMLVVNLGQGTGAFPATGGQRLSLGSGPRGLAVADLNGDGHLDLVTTTQQQRAALIYHGDGKGTFTLAPLVAVNPAPVSVTAADVNRDGRPDLLVACSTPQGSQVAVRLATSAGGFQAAAVPEVAVGLGALGVTVADVNHDGQVDLLTANGTTSTTSTVSVRLGDGTGGFRAAPAPEVSVGVNPSNVVVGDLNRDGHPDFIAASNSESVVRVSVHVGDGTGRFQAAPVPTVRVGLAPCALALVDLNKDGQLDLLVGNNGTRRTGNTASVNSVSVRLGDGAAQFHSPSARRVPVANGALDLAVGDINNDGFLDFLHLSTTYAVSVRLGNGRGGFAPPPAPAPAELTSLGRYPEALALGDVNNDGNLDFVIQVTRSFTSTILVYWGDGRGGFSPAPGEAGTLTGTAKRLVLVDVTGDGNLDLLAATEYTAQVRLGDGNGGFRSLAGAISYYISDNPMALAAGDVNNDGHLDLLTANYQESASVRLGNGSGAFAAPAVPEVRLPEMNARSLALGDVNEDGKLDFVASSMETANGAGDDVAVRLGTGTGAFTAPAGGNIAVDFDPTAVALGDVNGDGHLDILTSGSYRGMLSVRLGDGRGNFAAPAVGADVGAGSYPTGVHLADLDNDGDLDVLLPNGGDVSVSVRLNGAFSGTVLPVRPSVPAVAAGLTVYPNPARQTVYIHGELPPGPYRLLDLAGREVRRQPAGPSFRVAGLPPGLYLLRCGPQTVRLVVE
ncbi:FG-GAP-like repeat-containing protein [Hymenobacter sp. UYP22]|uniref:FG-GAP-like repeat-containing protein n=1 Tax=Hymenobacter sp. UYP22 TaxID=3156348 RepID=UPI003398E1D6